MTVANVHRNLETVATVATVATPFRSGALQRCHLIKEVATGGNTNTLLNIGDAISTTYRLYQLPQINRWQRTGSKFDSWRPLIPELLPPLPLLPRFLKSQQHLDLGHLAEVAR
jgi:hypothetical protein